MVLPAVAPHGEPAGFAAVHADDKATVLISVVILHGLYLKRYGKPVENGRTRLPNHDDRLISPWGARNIPLSGMTDTGGGRW